MSNCPEPQGYENIHFSSDLAIDDAEQILDQYGLNIIRGLKKKAGIIIELNE